MRKPSNEEIIQHIDMASDLQRISEKNKDLSTVYYQETTDSRTEETNSSF